MVKWFTFFWTSAFLLTALNFFAINYTWNGSVSNQWNNGSNWTPNGIPGAFDNVTIGGGVSNSPVLSSSVTITAFTMNAGALLDIGGFVFIPTGTSSLTGANILSNGGYLKFNGTTSTISTSTIQCRTRISGSVYTLSNSVFSKYLLILKTGASIANSVGNIYTDTLWVENNGTGALRFGVTTADTYNNIVILKNLATGDISMAYNSSSNIFNGNIEVNSLSGGNVNFGISGGTCVLNSSYRIYEGIDGFVKGNLELRNFTQLGTTTPQTLMLDYGACCSGTVLSFKLGPGVTFNSDVNFSGSNFYLNGGVYNGTTTTLTKITNGAGINPSEGGNVFNSVTTYIQNNTASIFRLADINPDTYNGCVHFSRGLGSSVIDVAYNGVNSFKGDIYIDCGVATSTNTIQFGGGNGTVLINGATPQTIYRLLPAKIPAPVINRLIIDKSTNNLTLNTAVNIYVNLTMTAGIVISSTSNVFNLNSGTTCNLGGSNSYINGPVNYMHSGSTAATLNFPIGKGGIYRPAILTVLHTDLTPVTYTAEVFNSSANALGYTLPSTIDLVSLVRYWQIDRESVSNLSNAQITLFYDSGDGVTDPTNLTIAKTIGAGTAWFDVGGIGSTPITGSITSNSFTSFSKFTLANKISGINPLPVELLTFNVIPIDNQVVLTWQTASENNNDYFTVERTIDGLVFEEVIIVDGAGNSSKLNNYDAVDRTPFEGTSYYRLKQTDFNGKSKYSQLVDVSYSLNNHYEIFPNPSNGKLDLKLTNNQGQNVLISLFDIAGNKLYEECFILDENQKNVSLDFRNMFDKGLYCLCILEKETIYKSKIVIE